MPVEDIVNDYSLLVHLDAANADHGIYAFPNGCSGNSFAGIALPWFNLGSGLPTVGTLTNFSSCGANLGWNGSGTVASPYRLSFNNTQSVTLGTASNLNFDTNQDFTLEFWGGNV